jgi:FRG domain
MRQHWVFRGHADDTYKLLPTALRQTPPAQLGYTCASKIGVQRTNQEQVDAEFERLHEFYWSVDAQGLHVAGNNDLLRTPSGWREREGQVLKQGWPIDDLLPLLALAQHYGVPTRLLDWSDKPHVAAYFASIGAVKKRTTTIGIWALNLDWIIYSAFPGNAAKMAVYVVTAPRASNPNLHAQGGIFTTENLVRKELRKLVTLRPVDKIVSEQWLKLNHNQSVMAHFTLPSTEAGKLLRLLHYEGISAATLFPGYQGAADSLAERALWDAPEVVSYWIKP